MRSQVFWCLGTYGSASTWLFNLVRQICMAAQPGQVRTHFVSGAANLSVLDDPNFFHVVKSHEVDDPKTLSALKQRATKILVTVRDPRDAIASLLTYHDYDFERASSYVKAAISLCLSVAPDQRVLLLSYESRFFDEIETIERVAMHLALPVNAAQRRTIFEMSRREVIEKHIANLPNLPGVLRNKASGDLLDPATHWHSYHAGRSGATGRWREVLTPAQADAVLRQMGDLVPP